MNLSQSEGRVFKYRGVTYLLTQKYDIKFYDFRRGSWRVNDQDVEKRFAL